MRGQREYCSFFITEFYIFHLFLSPQRLIRYLFHFRFKKYNRGQDRCHLRTFSISVSATLLTFQRSPHIIRVHSAIEKKKIMVSIAIPIIYSFHSVVALSLAARPTLNCFARDDVLPLISFAG